MKRLVLRLCNLLGQWRSQALCLLSGKRGKVLVFHEVRNDVDVDESCRISTQTFRNIIDRERGKSRFVSVDSLFENDGVKDKVVITFDDVPYSFLENAYPILKERNIPFTLFVCKKFVGREGFLSEHDIRELDKEPLCTIGAHTMNHVRLRDESDSREDIIGSKKYLKELLHHDIKYFAYPYGRHDSVSKKNRNEVEEAGFVAAFSTIQSFVPNKCDRLFVPRIEIIR